MTRYLPLGTPPEPLRVEGPLRVLVVCAGPGDMPAIDTAATAARIQAALAPLAETLDVIAVLLAVAAFSLFATANQAQQNEAQQRATAQAASTVAIAQRCSMPCATTRFSIACAGSSAPARGQAVWPSARTARPSPRA